MSDYFDVSIYVDADVDNIETWYLERFQKLLKLAEKDPTNYYHRSHIYHLQKSLKWLKVSEKY